MGPWIPRGPVSPLDPMAPGLPLIPWTEMKLEDCVFKYCNKILNPQSSIIIIIINIIIRKNARKEKQITLL